MIRFLVWSAKGSPLVHILTPEQAESRLRTMVDNGDYCANLFSFGFECDYAVPVNTEAMELFAMHYTGQWQDRMRYIAACLALGQPIEPPEDPEGGSRAALIPEPPVQPPSGDRAVSALRDATVRA